MLKPKRILIINIFGIGDVLFTTPLISSLKTAFPDVFIGFVCNKRAVDVLKNNPKIDRIFLYERDDYRDCYKASKMLFLRQIIGFCEEIRKEKFNAVLDLSINRYFNFLTWYVGIKHRIGFNYKNRSFLLTRKIPIDGCGENHVIERYLGLLKEFGVSAVHKELEVFPSSQDETFSKSLLERCGVKPGDKVVALIPGGGASWGKNAVHKRWPAEKYAQLADKIIEKFSAKVILLGDTFEQELCRKVEGCMHQKAIELSGKTTVLQLAALLKQCRCVIVNDGGPLHVAVAAKAKTVSIFGPVDENMYGPYPQNGHLIVTKDIACRPCYRHFRQADCEHHNCLHLITLNDVLEKAEQIL